MPLHSVFIVSVPRSGSTLLTNMLDVCADVICPPESFFPAVLDQLHDHEMSDRRKVAALFVVSCSDGSPLTLEEAEQCIQMDKKQTLDALAIQIAIKQGRDPDQIKIAIWKFTRMVGCWNFAARIGGRFIILRRNLLNVYESQFRVPFGAKNKNPFRFALFAESYEAAFSGYPAAQTLHLEYAGIPSRFDDLVSWIGSSGIKRASHSSTLEEIAERNPWHANINKPFENKDHEKIRNLSASQIRGLRIAKAILKLTPSLNRKARKTADQRQMLSLRSQAEQLLQNS